MAEGGYVLHAFTHAFSTIDNSLAVSDIEHRALHNEDAFKLTLCSSATTNNTVFYVQVNGPENTSMLITNFDVYLSDGFADLRLIKISTSSTHVNGDNELIPYNKNNGSTNLSDAKFYDNPTLVNSTASGNYIADRFQLGSIGASSPIYSIGSAISLNEEAFLIGNSTYIIQIDITTTAASCWFTGRLSFFQHE